MFRGVGPAPDSPCQHTLFVLPVCVFARPFSALAENGELNRFQLAKRRGVCGRAGGEVRSGEPQPRERGPRTPIPALERRLDPPKGCEPGGEPKRGLRLQKFKGHELPPSFSSRLWGTRGGKHCVRGVSRGHLAFPQIPAPRTPPPPPFLSPLRQRRVWEAPGRVLEQNLDERALPFRVRFFRLEISGRPLERPCGPKTCRFPRSQPPSRPPRPPFPFPSPKLLEHTRRAAELGRERGHTHLALHTTFSRAAAGRPGG